MLNKSIALMLLLAFAAMTFSKTIILAGFLINRNYIAQNLCENRSRPVIACGGTCVLSKKFKKEAGKDQENAERKAETQSEVLTLHFVPALVKPERRTSLFRYAELKEDICCRYQATFFPPPRG